MSLGSNIFCKYDKISEESFNSNNLSSYVSKMARLIKIIKSNPLYSRLSHIVHNSSKGNDKINKV